MLKHFTWRKIQLLALCAVLAAVPLLAAGATLWMLRGTPKAKAEPLRGTRITSDLVAVNQAGETVAISSLRRKVWVVAQFFAVCPQCAARNSRDLKALEERFGGHPDFHLVCITIDPEQDDVERLQEYAAALGADVNNWWFLTGERAELLDFLTDELGFQAPVERDDPEEARTLGRYEHDLGLVLVNRRMEVIGKRDLAWAGTQSQGLHASWQRHLHGLIERELNQRPRSR
jgi:protein SCO1